MSKNLKSSIDHIKILVKEAIQIDNKEEIEKIAKKLVDLGVEKSNDLLELNEKDITEGDTIKLVQAKKLRNYASQGEYSLEILTSL